MAGVASACAARSEARVRVISVAGALKISWEKVPNSYTKFWIHSNCGTPGECFLQEQFLQQNKNLLFMVELLVVYFRVDFVRELPAGPQRCVTFVWATTQGDFVAYCNLRQSWSDDKS